MDFVTRLPCSKDGYDSIWVIVDRLTKSAHFLPVKSTYPVAKLAKSAHFLPVKSTFRLLVYI